MGYCWVQTKARGKKQIVHVKCNGYSHYCIYNQNELGSVFNMKNGKLRQKYCKDCVCFAANTQDADEIMYDYLMGQDEDYFYDDSNDRLLLGLLKKKIEPLRNKMEE